MKAFCLSLVLAFTLPLTVAAESVIEPATTTVAPAEETLTVTGMHCGGCAAMITKSVCDNAKVKAITESCSVALTNEKAEQGQLKLKLKPNTTLDKTLIQTQLSEAGNYKIADASAPTEKKADHSGHKNMKKKNK